jgi:asparagine synthase (glutamine-hydrolysing)
MPPAFACLSWPPGHPGAQSEAEGLIRDIQRHAPPETETIRTDGLFLADLSASHATPSRILPVRQGAQDITGFVYGTLFPRRAGAQSAVSTIPRTIAEQICQSRGASLLTEYWGHYILFLRTPDGAWCQTDPIGAFPCFHRRIGEVSSIFSHLEACPPGFRAGLSLDIGFLRRLRLYDKIQTGQTGFLEIRELGGGQRLDLETRQACPEQVWDPRRIAKAPLRLSDADAAHRLKQTVKDCVASWAGHSGALVMDLSGGLDSSIVTSCLANAVPAPQFEIVHHLIRSGDAPELAHASATSRHLGRSLTVIDILPSRNLPEIDNHPASTRPWRQFLGLGFESLLPERLQDPDTAFFTGQGGDHLFLMTRSSLGLADCLLAGSVTRALSEWLNAARLSDTSLWQTLSANLPYLLGRSGRSVMARAIASRLDRPQALAGQLSHWLDGLPDWVLEPDGVPPGKFEQVSTLLHMFMVRDPMAGFGGRRVIHPLISQPVIELCLRLPVWQLCLGGINRGLARAAFRGDIPDCVRLRTTKGEATQ